MLKFGEVMDAAMKIYDRQEKGAEMDAGFDAGEFSGPANDRITERLIKDLAEANGFTLEQIMDRMSEISNDEAGYGSYEEENRTHIHICPQCRENWRHNSEPDCELAEETTCPPCSDVETEMPGVWTSGKTKKRCAVCDYPLDEGGEGCPVCTKEEEDEMEKCSECGEQLVAVSFSEYQGAKTWPDFYCSNPKCSQCRIKDLGIVEVDLEKAEKRVADEVVRAAAEKFPAEFGLKGYGGIFCINLEASYVSSTEGIMLYVFLKNGCAFCKGTPEELQRTIRPIHPVYRREGA